MLSFPPTKFHEFSMGITVDPAIRDPEHGKLMARAFPETNLDRTVPQQDQSKFISEVVLRDEALLEFLIVAGPRLCKVGMEEVRSAWAERLQTLPAKLVNTRLGELMPIFRTMFQSNIPDPSADSRPGDHQMKTVILRGLAEQWTVRRARLKQIDPLLEILTEIPRGRGSFTAISSVLLERACEKLQEAAASKRRRASAGAKEDQESE